MALLQIILAPPSFGVAVQLLSLRLRILFMIISGGVRPDLVAGWLTPGADGGGGVDG